MAPARSSLDSLVWKPAEHIDHVWFGERADPYGVPLRASAVALNGGDLAILSPVLGFASRPFPSGRAPSALVAPNHFHNLGLREQLKSTPTVRLCASPTAVPRLEKRIKKPFADVGTLQDELPKGFSFLVPPGTRAGEAWLSAPGARGRAWMVGDAFFNIRRTPRSLMGLLLKVLGICPGLLVGTSFRWLVRDRPGYRAWLLEKIASERPTTLVPCHGDVLFDEHLAERLDELVRRRF